MSTHAHSFGGSALNRHVFDFETVPDADPGLALDPAGDPGFGEPFDYPPDGGFADPVTLSTRDWGDPGAEHQAALEAEMTQYRADLQATVDAQLAPLAERLTAYEDARMLEDGHAQMDEILAGHNLPEEAQQQVQEYARDMVSTAIVEHVAGQLGWSVEQAAEFFAANPEALQQAWHEFASDEVARAALDTAAGQWRWESGGGRQEHYAGGGTIVDALTGQSGPLAPTRAGHDWSKTPGKSIFQVLQERGGE
jgi:hypothetical protein